MSQHGCPERLSNRPKGFQESGSQATMEVLVETLTGTAFEMTVSPSDTIFAIKSKIFRVEGIPVAQQHLLYNLKELEDWSSLSEHAIGDGARLRLVVGMRGGPISTRRLLPPPTAEPWRDIERLLDADRDEGGEWSGSGCKVTVLVFRDGERVNMLRVKENHDGTYSPIDHNKYSTSLTHLVENEQEQSSDDGITGSLQENAVTMGKMLELRRRMENLSISRALHSRTDKVDIQKTRSEETLSVPSLLDDAVEPFKHRNYTGYSEAEDIFAPLYDGNYTRYDYDCSFSDRYALLPPIGTRTDSEQSVQEAGNDTERLKLSDALAGSILVKGGRRERDDEAAILEECLDSEECHLRQDSPQLTAKDLAPISAAEYGGVVCGGAYGRWRAGFGGGGSSTLSALPPHAAHSASSLHVRAPPPAPRPPHPKLSDALFSSSTSDLESLKRTSGRILPALSRHRNREHLHLSDEGLDLSHSTLLQQGGGTRDSPTPAQEHPGGRRTRVDLDEQRLEDDNRLLRYETPDKREKEIEKRTRESETEITTHCGDDTQAGTTRPIAKDGERVCVCEGEGARGAAPAGEGARERKVRVRCAFCRKRLSIATVHTCRCGAEFCAPHRYAEVHGCLYDYKSSGHHSLQQANPLVTAPKLPKI